MGCSLSHDKPSMHPDIQSDLRVVSIATIIEVAQLINDTCAGRTNHDKLDFEDIFGLTLSTPENFFNLLKQFNPETNADEVSIYEAITSLTILCQDEYELKVTYLFSIFDFNANFELDKT